MAASSKFAKIVPYVFLEELYNFSFYIWVYKLSKINYYVLNML